MIEDDIAHVAAHLPPSLAMFGGRIAVGPGGPAARLVSSLRQRATFDAVIDGFGAAYGGGDRRAIVSFWTQYYLPALIIPSLTARVCLGRALPVGFEQVGLELDAQGCPARFLLPDAEPCPAGLIDGHLRPFVELCHGHCGVSRRVLWGNAGVIVDHVLRELREAGARVPQTTAEADACLGWHGASPSVRSPLPHTFRRPGPHDARCRRVCCMRYRLPGVASCGTLCPAQHPTDAPC